MSAGVPSEALEGLLYALVALAPFAFGSVEPWARAVLECGCFALALGVFSRGRRAPGLLGAWLWLVPAAAALLGAVQSLTPALDGPRPALPFSAAPAATAREVTLWAAYAALLWSAPRVIHSHRAARRLSRVLFGTGLAVFALGTLQAATSRDLIYWTRPTTPDTPPFGPYYNVDHAANLMLLAFAAGLGPWWEIARSRPAPRSPEAGGWLKEMAAWSAGLAALAAGVLYCRSEGAVIAAAMAAAGLGFLHAGFEAGRPRRLGRALAFLAAASAAVFLAFRHVGGALASGGELSPAVSSRFLIYADAWRWLRDAPWFGTGLGTFPSLYPAYQDAVLRSRVDYAHSDWVQASLEGGLAALFLALGMALGVLSAGARAWWSARSSEMRALIGGLLAAVLAGAFHSLFDFPFQIPANALVLLAVCGGLASAPSWKDKVRSGPPSDPPGAGAVLLAAACALVGALAAVSPAVAVWQASRPGTPAVRAEFLARAIAREDDPRRWRRLGEAVSSAAAASSPPDLGLSRFALRAVARAVSDAPYDRESARQAGLLLWGLGRPGDAEEMFARARALNFAPLRPRRGRR